ncbi:hypothetical protein LINPERPRIM_LOCUS7944 [Linum perenne]
MKAKNTQVRHVKLMRNAPRSASSKVSLEATVRAFALVATVPSLANLFG